MRPLSLSEDFKFTRKRKTLTEKDIENFEKDKRSAVDFFTQLAFMKEAQMQEPKALLKLDYIFNNPNVQSFLEGDEPSCDKYATVYSYHSKYGVNKKNLPEASGKEKPITMLSIIEELLSKQSEISFVAVLKKTYFRDGAVSGSIFLYHFDKERYDLEKERIDKRLSYN